MVASRRDKHADLPRLSQKRHRSQDCDGRGMRSACAVVAQGCSEEIAASIAQPTCRNEHEHEHEHEHEYGMSWRTKRA